jgi:hypothetical protein
MRFKQWLEATEKALKRESILPYIPLGPGNDFANVGMGVPSRYVGPEETGEKGQHDVKTADFGERRRKKRGQEKNKPLGRI